jgi:Ca2+/Na+ antiporter
MNQQDFRPQQTRNPAKDGNASTAGFFSGLLVPFMVGLLSIWWIVNDETAVLKISLLFVGLAIAVFLIVRFFPVLSFIHEANWILSYCAFALFVATMFGLVFRWRG